MATADFIIGDSIASGIADAGSKDWGKLNRSDKPGVKKSDSKGISQVGAAPKIILGFLNELGESKLKNKTVILSSGITNGTSDLETVKKQLQTLKVWNSKVFLVGVVQNSTEDALKKAGYSTGLANKIKGINEKLEALAKEFEFTFIGGFDHGGDGIHPTYSNYYTNKVKPSLENSKIKTEPQNNTNQATNTQQQNETTQDPNTKQPDIVEPPIKPGKYIFNVGTVSNSGILFNSDLGTFSVVNQFLDENPYEYVDQDYENELFLQDNEFTEVLFVGLEELIEEIKTNYKETDNKKDEDFQVDSERGLNKDVKYIDIDSKGAGGNNKNEKVIESIRKATSAVGKGESGRCARFTFNHANNFVKALIGKDLKSGATLSAGGNANQSGYHNALVSLGYKKQETISISKSELKQTLETVSNWDIGDVVAYWGISSEYSDKGGVKYGHTQIFTNGEHGSSNKWTSDNFGNFGCAFVYNSYKVSDWKLVILKSPTSGKKIA